MKPKKQFSPQMLRSLLTLLIIVVAAGGAFLFYVGLGVVKDYSTQVSQRLIDAEASGKQIEELQVLKGQITQSSSLIQKANKVFATPENYRSRALSDIKNYADAAGISVESTRFDGASAQTVIVKLTPPVSYVKLIAFLSNIESNLPKFQISSVSLGHVNGGGADSVSVGEIKIDIAVR